MSDTLGMKFFKILLKQLRKDLLSKNKETRNRAKQEIRFWIKLLSRMKREY